MKIIICSNHKEFDYFKKEKNKTINIKNFKERNIRVKTNKCDEFELIISEDNNKIISQTNMESIYVEKINDSLMYSPSPRSQSTIIVKNDMGNIITEIDKMRKKLKH